MRARKKWFLNNVEHLFWLPLCISCLFFSARIAEVFGQKHRKHFEMNSQIEFHNILNRKKHQIISIEITHMIECP